MARKPYTEEQIIAVLKEGEAGRRLWNCARSHLAAWHHSNTQRLLHDSNWRCYHRRGKVNGALDPSVAPSQSLKPT